MRMPGFTLTRRFRSLRWRLTFLYLGLLSILLLVLGVGQYFAAREVLYRSSADVTINEYQAVLTAFRREVASRAASPRAELQQLAQELKSRRISAAIFDLNGVPLVLAPATLGAREDIPYLPLADYLNAIHQKPQAYYLAQAGNPPSTHLVVLNPVRIGARAIGLAQLSIPTDEIDQTLRVDRQLAIGLSLVVLLLALLLSPLIVGRALRPLDQMSRTARAIAAGDYSQRVSVADTADEIGELGTAFNKMAAGVDAAFEVRRASEDRMRQFVADASHELRTPLTSIAGYIDVLGRRQEVDPATLQSSLASMQVESARMTRLVNDLLTLTRFESGKAPSRRPLPLDAWLNETLDELHLREQGASETRTIEPGIVVEADPEALKQVVSNLAQNALKYAPGSELRWSLFREDGRAAIRLVDTGPGIPRSDLPHVFERFYRGEKARDRSAGGSGLGLAIARSIVEAHQGTIDAESEPGKGATFTAWLPLPRA